MRDYMQKLHIVLEYATTEWQIGTADAVIGGNNIAARPYSIIERVQPSTGLTSKIT